MADSDAQPHTPEDNAVTKFIARWAKAEAAERANYVLFLSELSDILGVPRPDPAGPDTEQNSYVFERAVTFHHRGSAKTSTGRIDLYKRDCFVLEAKQYATAKEQPDELALALDNHAPKSPKIARGTAAWDRAMLEALGQAERYARSLPTDEDPPPFLLVVDVGHVIELYADFTQKGKNYLPFPDARSHRIKLADLSRADIRERLRQVWTTPLALDPSKHAAAVTREVAGYLAELAKSFEKQHEPKAVAEFLSRCLFCMFAEDVGLLPKDGFLGLIDSVKPDPGSFVPMMELLFEDMNQGRFSGVLKKKLLYFNGGLFASARALPVNGTQLGLLRSAAALEWRNVEPAIFGTLLERALSPEERHKLGAHYTPRAYVERLVLPTLIEPLREEWSGVRVAAVAFAERGTDADLKKAKAEITRFHQKLCATRVLDPACGSGNFLYVALEQMKRLEGEVISLLGDLGETDLLNLQGVTVDPHQFLGIEINPRAAAIAELVLWIGYLQWHFRVHGEAMPAEPVLRKFNNIECRDAVLTHDGQTYVKDGAGNIRYVWDRKTTKLDPVTGRDIPDDKAVRPLDTYTNPRPATWPDAEYIIGNPPFLGGWTMRNNLGEGYVEVLWETYPAIPEKADFVMYWWHKAALSVQEGRSKRFGFITTNSITQTFQRRVLESHLKADPSFRIAFAIPDHPWVDATDGASVRIAMTIGTKANIIPRLARVVAEDGEDVVLSYSDGQTINADLSIGADVSRCVAIKANDNISSPGVQLYGDGFIVEPEEAMRLRSIAKDENARRVVRTYINGRDFMQIPRGVSVIDFIGLSMDEARELHPLAYERVLKFVKPERDQNRRESIKKLWWRFGWERPAWRKMADGLPRYIATPETSKHRIFTFLDKDVLPDNMLTGIASDDAFYLGVLSSRIHVTYALAAGGRLGVGNDPRYNKSRCFDPFPCPDCTEHQKDGIRVLAEGLDAHRKRVQTQHGLGLTTIYNVLEKVRAGEALTAKDKTVHDAALVSTLRQLHDDLDAAVAAAYGWPWPLADVDILERVVALNAQRAAEEAEGHIRWLRPEYQQPLFAGTKQSQLGLKTTAKAKSGKKSTKAKKTPWPKTLAERVKAVETTLSTATKPLTASELTATYSRAKQPDIQEIIDTLVTLGRAHPGDTPGTYLH